MQTSPVSLNYFTDYNLTLIRPGGSNALWIPEQWVGNYGVRPGTFTPGVRGWPGGVQCTSLQYVQYSLCTGVEWEGDGVVAIYLHATTATINWNMNKRYYTYNIIDLKLTIREIHNHISRLWKLPVTSLSRRATLHTAEREWPHIPRPPFTLSGNICIHF